MRWLRWGAALVGIVALAGVGGDAGADEKGAEDLLRRKGLERSGKVYLLPRVEESFGRLGPDGMKAGLSRRGNWPDFGPPGEPGGGFDDGPRGPGPGGDMPPMPPVGPLRGMGGPGGKLGFGPRGSRGGPDRGRSGDDRRQALLDELGKLGDDELVERVRAGKSGVERLEIRERREVDMYLIDRLLGMYDKVAADAEVKAALKELNRGRSPKLAVGPAQAYEARLVASAAETLRDKGLRVNKGSPNFSLALDDDVAAGVKELDQARRKLVTLEGAAARAEDNLKDLIRQRQQLAEQDGRGAKAAELAVRRKALDAAIRKARAEDRGPQLAEVAAQRRRFVERLRDLRALAGEAERRRETVPNDPEVKEALTDLDHYRVPKQKHRVILGKKLDTPLKRLAELERAVDSRAVPLDADRGMFWVTAAVGEAPAGLKMLVDPGEPFVRLSARTADALGLRLDGAAEADVTGPDGRAVHAHRVALGALAVGGCKAEGVACLVLPEAAGDPPPVLGASFLDRFVADLDPAASRLRLARVEVGPEAAKP